MTLVLKATPPQGPSTDARGLYPLSVSFTAELEEPATLTMLFRSDWDRYTDETSVTNNLAMGGHLVLTRSGDNVFNGYVQRRDGVETDGEMGFTVLGLDKFAKIRDTAASSGGEFLFTMTTPALSFSQTALVYLGTTVEDVYRYLPVTTAVANYLPNVSYAMVAVNTGSKTFTIAGDHTNEFYAGIILTVYGSTGNDGLYTVVSAAFGGVNTVITVSETVPDSTADGFVQSEYRTNFDTLAVDITAGDIAITAIDQSPDVITIDGDHVDWITHLLNVTGAIRVTGSTGNDDDYTPTGVALVGGDTEITVAENLPDSTADGDVTIRMIPLSTSYKALLPEGIVMIDNEAIYYSAYFSTDVSRWLLLVELRGACETTAATHVATREVRQLVPLKIHPAEAIVLEGLTADSPEWAALSDGQYFPQVEEGWIELTQSIHELLVFKDFAEDEPRRGYTELRLSYSAFNELSSDAVRLDSIATTLFTATKANAGPGLSGSEYIIDVPSIRLTRVVVDSPIHVIELLNKIEGEIGFAGSGTLEVISTFYDSQSDELNYKSISQKSTPDRIIVQAYSIEHDVSLDDIHSAVIVKYQSSRTVNLARRTRSWVAAIGDSVGSETENITGYLIQKSEEISGYGWKESTSYPGGYTDEQKSNALSDYIFDGLEYTGFGLSASTQPGSGVTMMYCWFDDDANSFMLERIRAVFDVRRQSDPDFPIDIQIVGFTSFTPPVYDGAGAETSPPSATGQISLHGALRIRYEPDQDTDSIAQHVMEASGIGVECQAIGIVFDGIPATRDNLYRMMLKELEVNGSTARAVLVRLTGGFVDGEPFAFLSAPDTYDKLIDNEFGNYKVKLIDAGVATRSAAVGLGRLALLQSLALLQTRVYQCGLQQGIPVLGETVRMPDDYEGIVISVQYEAAESRETLALRVLNTDQELI